MTSEKKSFLLAQLQEAIDEAVSESGRVSSIVEEMKRHGYDLCLMLESTVTISPAGPHEEEDDMRQDVAALQDLAAFQNLAEQNDAPSGEIQLTDEDREFLRELNIASV
jgi:hypothetical protein